MKITDYAPRAGALDTYLTGTQLIGIEVGCDVGAHAEAMLQYCDINKLYLVDLWTNDFYRGYCMGRILSKGWKNNVEFIQSTSHIASEKFKSETFDFIYIDIAHDEKTVWESLEDWWPKLKKGGILGYRNYSPSNKGVTPTLNKFTQKYALRFNVEEYHSELIIFKD